MKVTSKGSGVKPGSTVGKAVGGGVVAVGLGVAVGIGLLTVTVMFASASSYPLRRTSPLAAGIT